LLTLLTSKTESTFGSVTSPGWRHNQPCRILSAVRMQECMAFRDAAGRRWGHQGKPQPQRSSHRYLRRGEMRPVRLQAWEVCVDRSGPGLTQLPGGDTATENTDRWHAQLRRGVHIPDRSRPPSPPPRRPPVASRSAPGLALACSRRRPRRSPRCPRAPDRSASRGSGRHARVYPMWPVPPAALSRAGRPGIPRRQEAGRPLEEGGSNSSVHAARSASPTRASVSSPPTAATSRSPPMPMARWMRHAGGNSFCRANALAQARVW